MKMLMAGTGKRMKTVPMTFAVLCFWTATGLGLAAPPNYSGVDAKAAERIGEFLDWIKAQKTVTLALVQTMEVQGNGMQQKMTTRFTVAVDKPGKRFALRLQNGMMGASIICDGKKVYTYLPMLRKYTVKDAPPHLSDLFRSNSMSGALTGTAFPFIQMLVADDPSAVLLRGVKGGRLFGEETVDGVACHHLYFQQAAFDWDAWVAASKPPVLVKIVPDMSRVYKGAAARNPQLAAMKIKTSIEFSDWKGGALLSKDAFVFKPPAGVQKSPPGFGMPGRARQKLPPAGKPAP